jgi:hypothetical protein
MHRETVENGGSCDVAINRRKKAYVAGKAMVAHKGRPELLDRWDR